MSNLGVFDRKLPKDVLQHMVGPFVTAPKSSHRATAASLMAETRRLSRTGRGRSHGRGRGRGRTHKKKHRLQK